MSKHRKIILVVDDEQGFRDNICELLSDEGYQTLAADCGAAALQRTAEVTPDLILLDVKLPDAQGIEILEQLREVRPEVPVILMTAYGSSRLASEAAQGGAFEYITKPFDLDALLLTVRRGLVQKPFDASAPMMATSPRRGNGH